MTKLFQEKQAIKIQICNQCSITWFWSTRLTKMSRSLPKNILSVSYLFNCFSYNILEFRISNFSWRKIMILAKTLNRAQLKSPNIWISFSQQIANFLHCIIFFLKALLWSIYQHHPSFHSATWEMMWILQVVLIYLTCMSEYGVKLKICKIRVLKLKFFDFQISNFKVLNWYTN